MKAKLIGLIVFLTGAATAIADLEPDFYVDILTSDGEGRIDPEYFYHSGSYPKTAKVQFDYHSWNYGRKPGTSASGQYGLFGFWNTSLGGISGVRTDGSSGMVFWHGRTSGSNAAITGTANGAARLEFDYINKTAGWSSSSVVKTIASELKLPGDTVTVPYHLCWLENCDYSSYLGIRAFRIFEQLAEGADPVVVREYLPACVNGRPALYDPRTKTVAYPTTSGFTIPMTNVITIAAGKVLHVSPYSATQRSVRLEADSELVFDGLTTLLPTEGVVLPASGVVTVSLPVSTGAGRYVLIDGLDADFSLSTFVLGMLPTGMSGVLTKFGTKLMLTLGETIYHPEALGLSLRSDGHGYIDTAYLFKSTTLPKTARAEFLFNDTTGGKGAAPGPTISSDARGVFGFWHGDQRSGARWYSTESLRLGSGNGSWSESSKVSAGDQSICINYLNGEVSWGESASALGIPTTDSDNRYYIYNLYNGVGPMNTAGSSVFSFRELKIYETSDNFATETLARDFVPCVDRGKPGIYDRVTGIVRHPEADTNGFVLVDTQWRVGVKNDVAYVAAGSPQSFATDGDGYLVLRRFDGGVVASGSGVMASFTMPTAGVEVVSTMNKTVAASSVEQVLTHVYAHDLTLGLESQLVFAPEGQIVISGTLLLPEEGSVSLTVDAVTGPGTYVVLRGVTSSIDLSKFSAGVTTSGYVASLERRDDEIVLRVADDPSGAPRFVKSVRSDGDGWIDTDYHYHGATYPKTAKVRFDFTNYNYGRKPSATSGFAAQFGFWNGSLFRSSGSDLTFWDGAVTAVGGFPKSGRIKLEIDYSNALSTITTDSKTTKIKENITVSKSDNPAQTYYVCGCMGNNSPSYEDIHSFQIWACDEQGNESLAVDYVPCVSAGKAALYDKVRKIVTFPTYSDGAEGAGFTAEWGEVMQRFAQVTTVSAAPVCTPTFAPQGAFTFAADGSVTPERALTSLTFVSRDSDGVEIARSVVAGPIIGNAYAVSLGNAVSVDVLVDETVETAEQDFGPVVVSCAGEALYRVVDRKRYELMLPADATVTFAAETGAVTATYYDANGEVIGSRELVGAIKAGVPLPVPLEGARYAVLRVSTPKPGLLLFVR